MVEGAGGQSLCLRPEFTIPLSVEYLAREDDVPADLYAVGAVFRQQPGEKGEFAQVDIERFGHLDREAVDAECFALAIDALMACGLAAPEGRMGDVGLMNALLDQLQVSSTARRRLIRNLTTNGSIDGLAAENSHQVDQPYSGILKVLEGAQPQDVRAFVKDVLTIAGITKVGGRDSKAIADRFLRRSAGETGFLCHETTMLLKRFLAINGEPTQVLEDIRTYATAEGLNLAGPLAVFEKRIGFMAERGVNLAAVRFEASFLRNFDYYTGFVFDMPSRFPDKPMIGGGRYDTLMRRLGSTRDIPAIGFAVWPERILAMTS